MATSGGLERFLDAQRGSYGAALDELRAGRKRSHWIWYVFPQLRGLGSSPMAERYGLAGVDEARAYLRGPTLRARLEESVAVVHEQVCTRGVPVEELMGSHIDALKLVSSLTLFAPLARELDDEKTRALAGQADAVLDAASRQGLPRCAFTARALAGA